MTGNQGGRLLAIVAAVIACGPAAAAPLRSPHSADACIECHRKASLKEGAPPGMPEIIIPEGDDPHRVLTTTCRGCHPNDLPAYWLVTFPKRRPGEQAAFTPPSPSPGVAPPPVTPAGKFAFENPHDEMDCDDCHQNKVSFTARTGQEKELVKHEGDVSDFCQTCHEDVTATHFPRNNFLLGGTTCLSCHQAHRATPLPHGLSEDYPKFVRETLDINPHGGNPYCLACHPNKPLEGEPAELLHGPDQLDRLCSRCHPGQDHHVLGKPATQSTWKMEFLKYPLQGGKLACVTCHLPHGGETPEAGGGFSLRGEPYRKMTDFCLKCHEEKSWGKLNAHDQLTPQGDMVRRSCLMCHPGVPEMAKKDGEPAPQPEFNDTMTAICSQCHEPFPHPDGIEHLLEPGPEMDAEMKAYEERREVRLPLDNDGRVTCATCHNPHERGLLTGPDSVGADEEHRVRLTTFNEICTPCHGRH